MAALLKALFNQSVFSSAEAFGAEDITSEEMRAAIVEWFSLYFRQAPTEAEDPSQRIPYVVVNKITKAVFSEYDSSIVEPGKSARLAWMDKNRKRLDAVKGEVMQWALVGGECYLKPNLRNGVFSFMVLRRDRYTVLARDADGNAIAIGTSEVTRAHKKWYTLLEKRTVDAAGFLTIENKLFESSDSARLGRAVSLATLEQYAGLPDRFTFPVPTGLCLVRVKTPMVNCVDGTPDGVSVYEPATQLIHNINSNERQYSDEFELGRMRLTVPEDMLCITGPDGEARRVKDKIFVGLESVGQNGSITTFAPALRGESFESRRQGYLKACENIIGLKRGMLSDVEAAERTAKEITSSEGDYNLTVIDFQRMWFDAVRDTLTLCNTLGELYGVGGTGTFDAATALSVSWGNGVLYDPDTEWAEILKLVQFKMLKAEIALAWKYDLPWETPEDLAAIRQKYMPELESMMEV